MNYTLIDDHLHVHFTRHFDKSTIMTTIRALKPVGKPQSFSVHSLNSLVRNTFNSLKGCRTKEADVTKVSVQLPPSHVVND